ncbi:MAG: pentapeptide repeat-containing protein [Planctomycetes bacterium]|nr:pentapeptide repeat-containing protein [Planctomycetota bacterium]
MTPLPIQPRRAPVRPRVRLADSNSARLLEEEVGELLSAGNRATVHLCGRSGLGKSTALAHLAATFAGDARLRLVDGPGQLEPDHAVVTVRAVSSAPASQLRFELLPWSDDDVLEYLLAVHPARVRDAWQAWQTDKEHDLHRWPGLCCQVLDLLADGAARSPRSALAAIVHRTLGDGLGDAAARALHRFTKDAAAGPGGERPQLDARSHCLLRSDSVLAMLAAQRLLAVVTQQTRDRLGLLQWNNALRCAVRHELAADEMLEPTLRAIADRRRLRHQAAVLTALCLAHTGYRPPRQLRGDLRGAWLRRIDLSGQRVVRAHMHGVDLGLADLRGSHFLRVLLWHGSLRQAKAADATFAGVLAMQIDACGLDAPGSAWPGADLQQADFRGACLDAADLQGARLDDADLREASLRGASMSRTRLAGTRLDGADLRQLHGEDTLCVGLDLRTATLDGARLRSAQVSDCNLAAADIGDLHLETSHLRNTDLTGSRLRAASLRDSVFEQCWLADVDWEGADLRGTRFDRCSFHLGNARSGLVDSTIASEGSRTGFYTDEALEDRFQAPEDVRKANLRHCDLRGADVEGTDFYLVDLRGARFDDRQRDWFRRCRALLDPGA